MRQPTQAEEADIVAAFEAMDRGLAGKVLRGRSLGIDDTPDGRVVLAVSPRVWDLPEALWSEGHGAFAIGDLVDGFSLDLQGATLVADATAALTVRVLEKASHLWLYGRKILAASVERFPHGMRPGDMCIVANPRGEALGIGRVIGNLKGSGEAVVPLHDLGEYLRDQ